MAVGVGKVRGRRRKSPSDCATGLWKERCPGAESIRHPVSGIHHDDVSGRTKPPIPGSRVGKVHTRRAGPADVRSLGGRETWSAGSVRAPERVAGEPSGVAAGASAKSTIRSRFRGLCRRSGVGRPAGSAVARSRTSFAVGRLDFADAPPLRCCRCRRRSRNAPAACGLSRHPVGHRRMRLDLQAGPLPGQEQWIGGWRSSKGVADSKASAMRSSSASWKWSPTTCRPIGRPFGSKPHGTTTEGRAV